MQHIIPCPAVRNYQQTCLLVAAYSLLSVWILLVSMTTEHCVSDSTENLVYSVFQWPFGNSRSHKQFFHVSQGQPLDMYFFFFWLRNDRLSWSISGAHAFVCPLSVHVRAPRNGCSYLSVFHCPKPLPQFQLASWKVEQHSSKNVELEVSACLFKARTYFSEAKKKKKKKKKSKEKKVWQESFAHVIVTWFNLIQAIKPKLPTRPRAPICATLYIVRGGARPGRACSATADCVHLKTQISPNVSTTGHHTAQVVHDICLIFLYSFVEEIHVNEVLIRSQAVHRGRISSIEQCIKQERWQGPPNWNEIVLSFLSFLNSV